MRATYLDGRSVTTCDFQVWDRDATNATAPIIGAITRVVGPGAMVACGKPATDTIYLKKGGYSPVDCCPECAILVRQALEPTKDYLSRSIRLPLKTARITRADWAQLTA